MTGWALTCIYLCPLFITSVTGIAACADSFSANSGIERNHQLADISTRKQQQQLTKATLHRRRVGGEFQHRPRDVEARVAKAQNELI